MRQGLPDEDDKDKMMNIAVFASGRGTNFSAIARAVKSGRVKANLALLVCDQPGAAVLGRARRAGVKAVLVERKDFQTKEDFENKIIQHLEENKIDLIALAGFMRLLSPAFVRRYHNRIINIHPSILPSFKGTAAIKDALEYGVKVTGVTVHFVDEELDHGAIILQGALKIEEDESPQSVEAKIHKLEHKLYPQAISLYVEGKIKVEGRKAGLSA